MKNVEAEVNANVKSKTHLSKAFFSFFEPFAHKASKFWEAWWLSGSAPDCCPAVPGLNPVSPQPTTDSQSSGGLPPGMALGCGLTSVRGNRGENYEK